MNAKERIELTANQAVLRATLLLTIRLVLVASCSVLTWAVLNIAAGEVTAFPPGMMLSGISMFPVNLICLYLTSKWMRQEGESLRESLAPRGKKLLREIGMGMLWQVVLFLPFIFAIMGTTWLLYGDGMFQAFETIFYNPDGDVALSPAVMLILGVITVVTFAPVNAPIEEAVYRGYSQTRLMKKCSVSASIALSALAFGIQHIFYATSVSGAIVYFAAFTLWGAASGVIVHHQKRLFPITVAHFMVNFFTSLPAAIFPALHYAFMGRVFRS